MKSSINNDELLSYLKEHLTLNVEIKKSSVLYSNTLNVKVDLLFDNKIVTSSSDHVYLHELE
jgi:hypothetical protein